MGLGAEECPVGAGGHGRGEEEPGPPKPILSVNGIWNRMRAQALRVAAGQSSLFLLLTALGCMWRERCVWIWVDRTNKCLVSLWAVSWLGLCV